MLIKGTFTSLLPDGLNSYEPSLIRLCHYNNPCLVILLIFNTQGVVLFSL